MRSIRLNGRKNESVHISRAPANAIRLRYWPRIVALLATFLLGPIAFAQTFPTRPVQVVVPYAAGSVPDTVIRVIGQKLSEIWSQPLIVVNKVGANGIIGTQFVARSAADGYTLVFGNSSTHATNLSLYANLGYDPVADFAPVIQVVTNTLFVAVPNDLPVKNLREFVNYAKANPGKLNFGSYGLGSAPHFAAVLLQDRAGITLTHVPYKSSSDSVNAIITNEIQLLFDSVQVVQQAKAGRLRIIAVTSPARWPGQPDIPTFAEQGVPEVLVGGWMALFAPKNTPRDIVSKLNSDVNKVLAMPEIRQRFQEMMLSTAGGSDESLRKLVQAEIGRGREMARLAGMKPE